jgi:hypothetical protein
MCGFRYQAAGAAQFKAAFLQAMPNPWMDAASDQLDEKSIRSSSAYILQRCSW